MGTSNNISCYHCQSKNITLYAKAKDIEYFTSDKFFEYYLCHDCEVLFIHPQPVNDLKEIYPANYYSFTDENGGLSFRIKEKLDQLFFKKHLNTLPMSRLNILDIGGGTGAVCDTIKRTDSRVTHAQIIDIDANAAPVALEKGHGYFCGRIEDFNSTERYDVILMLNLIEHVATPAAILQKAQNLLSPEGIIIIKTPNYQSLDARIFRHNSWGGFHCPRHWVIFNKKNLLSMTDSCGLDIKHFNYTQGAPFWTVSILHKLHQWKWIKADAKKPLVYHPLFGMISMATALFDFLRIPFAPLSQMFVVLKQRKN